MKQLLTVAFIIFCAIGSKAQDNPKFLDPIVGKNTIITNGKFVLLSWDGWGRKSRGCESWGLCKARAFYCEHNNVPVNCITGSKYVAAATTEQSGESLYIQIFLAEPLDKELISKYEVLSVDEDIVVKIEDEKDPGEVTIIAGEYRFDENLGKNGGYQISVK